MKSEHEQNQPADSPSSEQNSEEQNSTSDTVAPVSGSSWSDLYRKEDWWAVWTGGVILLVAFLAIWSAQPADISDKLEQLGQLESKRQELLGAETPDKALIKEQGNEIKSFTSKEIAPNPIKPWVSKLQKWKSSPVDAFYKVSGEKRTSLFVPVLVVGVVIWVLFSVGVRFIDGQAKPFLIAFPVLFLLATLAYILASQSSIKGMNLEYPLWALLVGVLISNPIGTPNFLKPAIKTEFYIKTGLVLLGAKILLDKLLILGIPGIFVAWVVTPIVLVSTYLFGQKVLKIASKSLNMTIAADMSVCGVSAAIATAAACKAKKEELSMAIGLSLAFTAVMMVVMPGVIHTLGLSDVLGGAWMGGTIDATGAVAAAGVSLGPQAEEVALTVKMIQNILIGVVSFFVAVYWVMSVERQESGTKPSLWEIWYRFPKFIIGFLLASLIFSYLSSSLVAGEHMVISMYKGTTDVFRGWLFCLAFVSIGLELNFKNLMKMLDGGKPLVLYVCGQTFNLILTLFMAWLMFEVVFKSAVDQIFK